MNHTVLARKWRPKKFADLVGQKSTVTILQNIVATSRLHHAYLLTGTRGVGKTTIARIIAKVLNCLNPEANEPCGKCENCIQIDIGRMVDVIEIDAASNTGVDNIREVIENAQYAPTSGKYKIYIIDEVHMLSKSAFNAMLKTLEEPPAHIIFILATTDPQKLPITILSRCLQLKLRNLAIPEIEQHLADILSKENIASEPQALELIANAAHGSMRDALSLTDQAIAFANGTITLDIARQMLGISDDGSVLELLQSIQSNNSAQLANLCQQLNNEGANLENLLEQINYSLFQIGLAQLSPQPGLSSELQQLAKQISLQDCQLYFEISNLGLEQVRKIDNKYPIFVMTLLRMVAFSIGSNEEKQIIVSSNNCVTRVIQDSNVSVQNKKEDKQLKEVIPDLTLNETLADSPNEEIIAHEICLEQENIGQESVDESIAKNVESKVVVKIESGLLSDNDISSLTHPKFDGNWLEFVKTINLDSINPEIATVLKNSQLRSCSDQELQLCVHIKFQKLVTAQCVDKIEQILWRRYQQHFNLSFNFTEEEQAESLSSHTANQKEIQQSLAKESIYNDPIIKDLIDNFSATIIPDSIKPI